MSHIPIIQIQSNKTHLVFMLLLILVVSIAFMACAPRVPPAIDRELLPPHTLVTIVAELKLYQSSDYYRFTYPDTPAGQNVFKATLQRLENFEKLYPGEFSDIVSFSRALALEKLGETHSAAESYKRVLSFTDSPLVEESARRIMILNKINAVFDTDTKPVTVEGMLNLYDRRIYNLSRLLEEIDDAEYDPLLMVLRERLQLENALFLEEHFMVIEDGLNKGIEALKTLIDDNPESKRVWSHRMMLADFYEKLAHAYVARIPPDSIDFNVEMFEDLAGIARELYYQISLADGYHEKLEAQQKLSAINYFISSTIQQSH